MEETWELAVVSEELEEPFLFSWSSKHTRLAFQMFASSLLALTASKFEIEGLSFFGMINFSGDTDTKIVFIILFGFGIYSFLAFIVRSAYESPKLLEQAATYRQQLISSHKIFKQCSKEIQSISSNSDFASIQEGGCHLYLPDSPDANLNVKRFVGEIFPTLRKWKYNGLGSPNVVGFGSSNIPKKYLNYGFADSRLVEACAQELERRVKVLDGFGNERDSGSRLDDIEEMRIEVTDFSKADFRSAEVDLKKQQGVVVKLRLKFELALVLRFLDVYFLAIILPLFASGFLLLLAGREKFFLSNELLLGSI